MDVLYNTMPSGWAGV